MFELKYIVIKRVENSTLSEMVMYTKNVPWPRSACVLNDRGSNHLPYVKFVWIGKV